MPKINPEDGNVLTRLLSDIRDKIFYSPVDDGTHTLEQIKTLDAVEENAPKKGAAQRIMETFAYKEFLKKFQTEVQIPIQIAKFFQRHGEKLNQWFETRFLNQWFETRFLNQWFETRFLNGAFHSIFTFSENKEKILQNALSACEIPENECVGLLTPEELLSRLPFFRMCEVFKELIQNQPCSREGNYGDAYDYNPFYRAFIQLGKHILHTPDKLGISEEFYETYWGSYGDEVSQWYDKIPWGDIYGLKVNQENVIVATNWYKLAYHYTRREELYYCMDPVNYYIKHWKTEKKENPFLKREQWIAFASELWEKCHSNKEEFFRECCENNFSFLEGADIPKLPAEENYRSCFEYYIYTDSIGYNYRKYIYTPKTEPKTSESQVSEFRFLVDYQYTDKRNDPNLKLYRNDYWTKGILYTVEKTILPENNKWGEILPLPPDIDLDIF